MCAFPLGREVECVKLLFRRLALIFRDRFIEIYVAAYTSFCVDLFTSCCLVYCYNDIRQYCITVVILK